jgi:NADPH-dependent curcumin reductase CurA
METRVNRQWRLAARPEGLENAPLTLRRLFTGANRGKQLLKVS